MSSTRRAYDLLRGYVNREWDRIQGVDADYSSASSELQKSLDNPIRSVRSHETPDSALRLSEPYDVKGQARRVLGVEDNADFAAIQVAFKRLNRRSDPANFPANSAEAYQAAQIQRRVQEAYRILTDGMDNTEMRFKSLEIE